MISCTTRCLVPDTDWEGFGEDLGNAYELAFYQGNHEKLYLTRLADILKR